MFYVSLFTVAITCINFGYVLGKEITRVRMEAKIEACKEESND